MSPYFLRCEIKPFREMVDSGGQLYNSASQKQRVFKEFLVPYSLLLRWNTKISEESRGVNASPGWTAHYHESLLSLEGIV